MPGQLPPEQVATSCHQNKCWNWKSSSLFLLWRQLQFLVFLSVSVLVTVDTGKYRLSESTQKGHTYINKTMTGIPYTFFLNTL